ncbi:MAG: hypothetical protein AB7G37_07670 [Solirubrobacteraceae bacterium]
MCQSAPFQLESCRTFGPPRRNVVEDRGSAVPLSLFSATTRCVARSNTTTRSGTEPVPWSPGLAETMTATRSGAAKAAGGSTVVTCGRPASASNAAARCSPPSCDEIARSMSA